MRGRFQGLLAWEKLFSVRMKRLALCGLVLLGLSVWTAGCGKTDDSAATETPAGMTAETEAGSQEETLAGAAAVGGANSEAGGQTAGTPDSSVSGTKTETQNRSGAEGETRTEAGTAEETRTEAETAEETQANESGMPAGDGDSSEVRSAVGETVDSPTEAGVDSGEAEPPSSGAASGGTELPSSAAASGETEPPSPGAASGGTGTPSPAAASAASKTSPAGTGPGGAGVVQGAIAAPSNAGALHVEGSRLLGENGQAVQLRGISTHGIAWFPDYINENAFQQFRTEWNANVIRLAMYTAEYNGYCTGGDRTYLKNLVRSGVRFAAAQDMYVIIDWHILSDSNPNIYKEDAKAFFREMSEEFSSYKNVLYEICNEPNGGTSWQEIKSYAMEVIPLIRENDPDAIIIVGTPNWSQYVDQAAADPITGYDNIMYALHFYAATHKDDLRTKLESAVLAGLPVFVSEYGICDASGSGAIDEDSAARWVSLMNQYGISYVAWSLSNKAETASIIQSGCTKTSGFTDSDLSASGLWLKRMLANGTGAAGDAASGSRSNAASGNGNSMASGSGSNAASGSQGEAFGDTQAATVQSAPGSVNGASGGTNSGPGVTNGASGGTGGSPAGGTNQTESGAGDSSRPTADGGAVRASAAAVNSWTSGGETYTQYSLEITNPSGEAVSQWRVSLSFDGAIRLTDGWNGDFAVSGQTLTVSSKSYNGNIPAGGTISDVGFIVVGGVVEETEE